jgi:hypothetical protein
MGDFDSRREKVTEAGMSHAISPPPPPTDAPPVPSIEQSPPPADMTPTAGPPAKDKNHELWGLLALLHGYNELAKLTDVLGQKVYCRVMRDAAEKEIEENFDVKIARDESGGGPTILTLGQNPPFIIFREQDIEAMRAAVAAYDAAKEKP